MNEPWWTSKSTSETAGETVYSDESGLTTPRIVPATPSPILRSLRRRVRSFTPEWTDLREGDAGVALARLFGTQLQPLLARMNRMPEKSFIEYLRFAGIESLPGTTAKALVEFEVSDGAPESVLIPRGFRVGAKPADDSDRLVVFETERDLNAAPGKLAEAHVQEGKSFLSLSLDDVTSDQPARPFGDRPVPGRALLLGIRSNAAPRNSVSLGFAVAPSGEQPPPVAAGGLQTTAPAATPVLRWEVLDGSTFESAEVVVDETATFANSGVVELRVPRSWRPGRPAGVEGTENLYWLRVRIVQGAYESAPSISLLRLNVVRVTAAETVRNEVLQHVPGTDDRMVLSRSPVVPGSLTLVVREGSVGGDLLDADFGASASSGETGGEREWTEVDSLSGYGPNDPVYTLDPVAGEVRFGDGVNGAALPEGFRHVRASSYRVGRGAAGAVGAEEIKTLINSAPFVTGVLNPLAASGGADDESLEDTLERGPQEIRARGRAVTEADYELMALRSPGADIVRARAVSGLHATYPGVPIPGVVGVFVVSRKEEEGPPVPDEQTLRSVAEYLTDKVAPAGVEVVASSPRFHRVRVEVRVVLSGPGVDVGETVREVLEELDRYLDPIVGGEDGNGWPFGRPIRYVPLVRRILAGVDTVSAVPRLNLVMDGRRIPVCSDADLSAHGLLWSVGHEVIPEAEEENR